MAYKRISPQPVIEGGTGLSTIAAHDVLVGTGTSPITVVAPSATAGIPLVSNGAAVDPSFTTAVVAGGGTGRTTLTNHGVLVGATTTAITQLAVGTNGQVLIGSTGADPAFATLTSTGGSITFTGGANTLNLEVAASGSFVKIQAQTATTQAALNFTTGITSTYNNYIVMYDRVLQASAGAKALLIRISTNGGSSYIATGYGPAATTTGLNIGTLAATNAPNSGQADLFNLTSGAGYVMAASLIIRTDGTAANTVQAAVGGAYLTQNQTVNAFSVVVSDGTNFSGVFTLYGVVA